MDHYREIGIPDHSRSHPEEVNLSTPFMNIKGCQEKETFNWSFPVDTLINHAISPFDIPVC